MTTPQSLAVLLRRWYLVLSGILFTVLLCWGAAWIVPPSYDAQGSMVLMPPSATVGDEGNPYLQLGGMSEALDVLVRQANAPAVRDRVLEEYPSASYTIEPDRSTSGSIVVVQATAETEAESLTVLDTALQTLPAVLTRMQDELEVIPAQRIDIMPVVVDAEAALNSKQTLQALAVAVVAGLSGTFLLTGLADGLLLSRRARPQSAAVDSGAGEASPEPVSKDLPAHAGSSTATALFAKRRQPRGNRPGKAGVRAPRQQAGAEPVSGEDARTR
ncbi:hypothetical protein GCM10009688_28190 [Arthrobacter gandavensis]|uniref:Capsular polysaccharide biosynthesis protein n=1 Tax=Arthrobacter gandavensis TaxID=169960 RepID=A0ABP5ASK3_9MICC|nr:hypothetical protein [Arthrobacter citreus]